MTAALLAAVSVASAMSVAAPSARPVVVASKPFGESYVLAEMFAQLLEARGHPVDRRPGLGATEVAFRALTQGAIDVYPEYTGTALVAVLQQPASSDARAVFSTVSRLMAERYGVHWLPPLGFENTYALAVRRELADRLRLRTLSDLAARAGELRGGFSPDFIGRADGLPGLSRAYGFQLRETRALLQSVKYQALEAGEVDLIDAYSTDGFIARHQLVVLEDDRRFFPSYEAAALVGARLWAESPGAVLALTELSGRLDGEAMRQANKRVEVDGEPIPEVARAELRRLGLVSPGDATGAAASGARSGLAAYLWARRGELLQLAARHLVLVGLSLLASALVAVPLGLWLVRARRAAEPVIRAIGVLQTIPGIALLAFMIPLLGIGIWPALVALFLYSLLPIVRNTYAGARDADPEAVASAVALGMTSRQALLHVRLPLAAPVIMAGVRTAAVIGVGTATLAAFIGAGGLGEPIVTGLALADVRMVLSGAIPAAALALLVDGLLAVAERRVTPRGLRPPR